MFKISPNSILNVSKDKKKRKVFYKDSSIRFSYPLIITLNDKTEHWSDIKIETDTFKMEMHTYYPSVFAILFNSYLKKKLP